MTSNRELIQSLFVGDSSSSTLIVLFDGERGDGRSPIVRNVFCADAILFLVGVSGLTFSLSSSTFFAVFFDATPSTYFPFPGRYLSWEWV